MSVGAGGPDGLVRPCNFHAISRTGTAERDVRERALASHSLPASAKWGRLEGYGPGSVTVDTVARFKGLERGVIILWALEGMSPARDRETLYVGMSRAKSVLYLCGSVPDFERIMAD